MDEFSSEISSPVASNNIPNAVDSISFRPIVNKRRSYSNSSLLGMYATSNFQLSPPATPRGNLMIDREGFEGNLQLLTTSQLRPWVKRYMVLCGDALLIFKSSKDKKTMMTIESGSIYQVQKVQKWHKKREHCFTVKSYGRTIVCSVETENLLQQWIDRISNSVKNCAAQGLQTSFSHLLTALEDDQIKFCEEVFSCMRRVVPNWDNIQTFTTDVRRSLQHSVKRSRDKNGDDNNAQRLEIEDRTEPWQIPYENLSLGKKVAEGFFGEVYKGLLWGKLVAIKRLKFSASIVEDETEKDKIIGKLKEEASIMSSLRHPNVLLFMGLSTSLPNICLVTEYMDNGSLHDVMQNMNITDNQFTRMIEDICCGMNYLHNRSILHLDLKPLNLLVDDKLTIKVADFGISRITQGLEKKIKGPQGYGTVLYMPTEIIMGGMTDEDITYYDYTYDVFSFGVMLFELLYMREHPDINFVVDDTIGYELLREPLLNGENVLLPPWWPRIFTDLIVICTCNDPKNRPTFETILHTFERRIKEDNPWYILRESSRKIKELASDPENHVLLEKHKVWDTLTFFIENYTDDVSLFYSLCAMIDLSNYNLENRHNMIQIALNRLMQMIGDKNERTSLTLVISRIGEFKYFDILLNSPYVQDKNQVFSILIEVTKNEEVALKFVSEGLIQCLFKIICDQPSRHRIELHLNCCSLLKQIANIDSEELLDNFVRDGGPDILIHFINNSNKDSVFLALQTLADIAVRHPDFAKYIEQKGINPIQMASRAYLGALVRKHQENEMLNKPNIFQSRSQRVLPQNHRRGKSLEDSDDVMKYVSFSFNKARDKLLSILDNSTNSDGPMISQPEETEIVVRLWELLKEQKDLNRVDTTSIKEVLKKELTTKMTEKQNLTYLQIDKIVGQMEPPSRITRHLFLGSEWNSSNVKELQSFGITHIVNLSAESPNYHQSKFEYKNVRFQRLDPSFSLVKCFDELYQHVENCFEKGHTVLVHSHLGVGRSAAFIVAYVMRRKQWALSRAFKYVKDKRPIIQINRRMMRSLMDIELSLGFESSLGVMSNSSVGDKSPAVRLNQALPSYATLRGRPIQMKDPGSVSALALKPETSVTDNNNEEENPLINEREMKEQ